MSGKDSIIEKILFDAQTRVDGILLDAETKASLNEQTVRREAEDLMRKFDESTPSYFQDVADRKTAVVKSDIKKYALKLKQNLIFEVFADAKKELLNLSDNDYMELMKKLLKEHSENGEGVIISKRDEKRFTQSFLDKMCSEKNLKIIGTGEFDGGFILTTNKYDKTVTIDNLLKEKRKQTEERIAEILFGEKV